jgi:O-antigen/teichoic acid export membrane protein
VSLRRTIPAGVIDSAASALATFVIGLYAVRTLEPAALGAYALVFSAYVTLMEVAARLVFLPAEIAASKRPPPERLGGLGDSLRQGAIVAVPAGILTGAAALAIPSTVSGEVVAGLTVSAMAATMLSPVQNHIRKMLHIGSRSWSAALISLVQLATMPMAIFGLAWTGLPDAWHPFGALAAATLVSGCAGALLWHRHRSPIRVTPIPLVSLMRSGRWLVLAGTAPGLGGFGAASLVAHLAGAPALGYAEAARVLARPVAVLSQGLVAVLGPDLMRAGDSRDRSSGRRISRQYAVLVAGLGSVYLLLAGFEWPLNPFALLVPQAYVVPRLTAAFIGVYVVDRVAGAGAGLQLLGAGRERAVAIGETVASVGRVLGGTTAPFTAAFAVPLGYLIMSMIRRTWARVLMRRLYADRPDSAGHSRRP